MKVMADILNSFLGSVAAAVAVAGLLYFLYRRSSQRCSTEKAYLECWWLPSRKCFRYVIRNMYTKDALFCIKYRAWLREYWPPVDGCSVGTFVDTEIVSGERILLPGRKDSPVLLPKSVESELGITISSPRGGQDLPVLCFRFECTENDLKFIHTDKLGNQIGEPYNIGSNVDSLMIEYYLKITSWFHLKHEIVRIFRIPRWGRKKQDNTKVDIFEWFMKKQSGLEQEIPLVVKESEVVTVSA